MDKKINNSVNSTVEILSMSTEKRDALLKTMTSKEFISSANEVVKFVKGAYTSWVKEDKQIMDTCESMLKEDKVESFEERKYFMETMKDMARKIDRKKVLSFIGGLGAMGIILGALIYQNSAHSKI